MVDMDGTDAAAAVLAGLLLAPLRGRIGPASRRTGYGLAEPRAPAVAAGGIGGRPAGLS
jgi:hypothetical protein